MPSFPKFHFSLPRWIGILRRKNPSTEADADDNNSAPFECYTCTQAGAPVFHSISCDRAHTPQWEAGAGSSLNPISNRSDGPQETPHHPVEDSRRWIFGRVLDPRSKRVKRWNRTFLLARAVALAVDPLFFYALSIGRDGAPCLYMDGGLAAAVTVLRTCADAIHVWHVWLQLRLAYVSRESLVVGCGKLVWDARTVAAHYLRSVKGFWFDAFVILPVPQMVFWLVVPKLIREEEIHLIMTMLLIIVLFQFLPKVYHCICIMKRMQKVTGYVFGTVWWGFALNLIAYFIASHVAGGCWYVLAIQRVSSCLQHECHKNNTCHLMSLACSKEVCYQIPLPSSMAEYSCTDNTTTTAQTRFTSSCLQVDGSFRYGIYKWALPVISSNSLAVKILYPIFWGLMTLR
eukprot:TRINITY_DN3742_c2_g1_i4.p1 TRINITY_DN3742_c2_g1~~TRINITY_DN3742_c2_g1_i4.p1  ORF type:complete len:419 (-),score=-13.95 TRINITY_DN3742_c2_g1_i4:38-1243(-)